MKNNVIEVCKRPNEKKEAIKTFVLLAILLPLGYYLLTIIQ